MVFICHCRHKQHSRRLFKRIDRNRCRNNFSLAYRIFHGELTKDTFAFSMSCVIPLSAFSLLTYPMPHEFSSITLFVTIVTAAVGGLFGAIVQQKIKLDLLKKAFSILVIYSGITMILK